MDELPLCVYDDDRLVMSGDEEKGKAREIQLVGGSVRRNVRVRGARHAGGLAGCSNGRETVGVRLAVQASRVTLGAQPDVRMVCH